ncbi:myelin protein zero-like protein 2b [Tachysurus fulvidraco]|uniref:myelin protein zero-like protein 2b n=1 Tax=Tachysurus fulvidraco TaxID=1234273 RepID=UPI000F507FA8|nr:myelin protein zero-like protein 2b [Tachysurus fulvidraco]XP_047665500.1 myelin protein zero-like protein 2b [Tachysurus fulvidraco]
MFRTWTRFLVSAVGVLLTGALHVLAIEVSTPKELTAVNGTSVRLKCTFKSSQPVTEKSASVSWSFKPLSPGMEEQFFYYHEVPFPPTKGHFTGHVTWSGDVMNNDGSITLNDVQFSFNGTYTCQVRNPPDVHGYTSEIRLEVVLSVKISEIGILAAAVGGAIVLVLVILAGVLVVRYFRSRQGDAAIELQDTKRGSVCILEESIPINQPEQELEKDKLQLQDDLEKKLPEEIDAKESDANLKASDDD